MNWNEKKTQQQNITYTSVVQLKMHSDPHWSSLSMCKAVSIKKVKRDNEAKS